MLDILLVEDNNELAKAIVDYLTIRGMKCDHAIHGKAAISWAQSNQYDVIILDINLPQMNGLEVSQYLRENYIDTPIIMLSARDMLKDKLRGFESGADDYMCKPFSLEELYARIQVQSRRPSGQIKKQDIGNLSFNFSTNRAYVESQEIKLTPIATKILEILIREAPNLVSKRKLTRMIWGDEQPNTNNLKVHLYALRKELFQSGASPTVETVPYKGVLIKP